MKELAKQALIALRNGDPVEEMSVEVVLFLMTCVIGWVKAYEIYDTTEFPEYKEADMEDLVNELNHISISSLVTEFLKENRS